MGEDRTASGRLLFGAYHPVTDPLVGLLGVNAEGYLGLRGGEVEGGSRLMLASHFFRVAAGLDLSLPDGDLSPIFSTAVALRRGGVLGTGSLLRLDWVPGRSQIELGISVPLHRNAGRTRPREDHISLEAPAPQWLPPGPPEPGVEAVLRDLRDAIRKIDRLVTPLIDEGSGDPQADAGSLAADLRDALTEAPDAGPAALAQVRRYHRLLERAFAIVAGDSAAGVRAAALARRLILDHVLFPYNRLLGQRRSHDRLFRFQTVAWTEFVRQVPTVGAASARWTALIQVFEELLDGLEEARAAARERWGDGRLVWLPLQYGLRPDDHDTQDELDALVGRAVERPFTQGNHITYVLADLFPQELRRTLRLTLDYHVLWIHDFAGRTEAGKPDSVSHDAVLGYLEALTVAVREYETTGRIPTFLILLDQFYYERNASHLWLSVLERPLEHQLRLPPAYQAMQAQVADAQRRLQEAVAASRLLQLQARQYGPGWIANLVKVHVNITNPPDRSFNSEQVVPIYGLPDDVIRDHRKVVFYDLDPRDSTRGEAVFTGAGLGEQYVGPHWEDRAIILQGPANRRLRIAARALLEVQGLSGRRMPWPFRDDWPAPEETRRSPERQGRGADRARILELHNETGYGPKELSVARATIYTLMPPASVITLSDARWGNHLAGSMLFGAVLRGARVLLMAPSAETTSNTGWPAMTRLWEFLSRMLRSRRELTPEMEQAGGSLRIGIYHPDVPATDIRGRFRALAEAERRHSWLDSLLAFPPQVTAAIQSLDSVLERVRPTVPPATVDTAQPKLHTKGEFLATGEGWDGLLRRPELTAVIRTFAVNQAWTLEPRADGAERARAMAEELAGALDPVVQGMLSDLSREARARVAYYLLVGSANQNNRSFLLDGEASVLVAGPAALQGLVDFLVLLGLCTWLDQPDQLEEFVPRPGGFHRLLARWLRTII